MMYDHADWTPDLATRGLFLSEKTREEARRLFAALGGFLFRENFIGVSQEKQPSLICDLVTGDDPGAVKTFPDHLGREVAIGLPANDGIASANPVTFFY